MTALDMRTVVAVLLHLPVFFGCSRDVVVSTSYPRSDGRAAFVVDMNKSDGAFELRAIRTAGTESALTKLTVSQCANGQLFYDSKNSVVFAYDFAEILYQSSGEELWVNLSIETCTKGTVACVAVMTSGNYKPPISIAC